MSATPSADLRRLHVPGSPLVLANVWDAASAKLVEQAGFEAVATSSAAAARALGSEDHEAMTADEALAAAKRIIDAVSVPVTVDFEAGYRLPASAIGERLIEIGAAGCNIEDSDHRNPGLLVDAGVQAKRVADIRAATGPDFVINARVDAFPNKVDDARHEAIERGLRYRDAGADCVYPIAATDEEDIVDMVDALEVVNLLLVPGGPSLDRLSELGAARVSVGAGLFRIMTSHVGAVLRGLREGDDTPFREG